MVYKRIKCYRIAPESMRAYSCILITLRVKIYSRKYILHYDNHREDCISLIMKRDLLYKYNYRYESWVTDKFRFNKIVLNKFFSTDSLFSVIFDTLLLNLSELIIYSSLQTRQLRLKRYWLVSTSLRFHRLKYISSKSTFQK